MLLLGIIKLGSIPLFYIYTPWTYNLQVLGINYNSFILFLYFSITTADRFADYTIQCARSEWKDQKKIEKIID